MNATVYIVRHGETQWNRDKILQGHINIPLNDAGRNQAERTGTALSDIAFDAVYSSDLARVSQTAEIIVKANKFFEGSEPEEVLRMEPNLRERTFGCLEGRPFKTMQDEAAARGLTTWEYTPEGAESHQDVSNRADAFLMDFLGDLKAEYDTGYNPTILIVTHGGYILELLKHLAAKLDCKFPNDGYTRIGPNTNFSKFVFSFDRLKRLRAAACVDLYNVDHLKGIDLISKHIS